LNVTLIIKAKLRQNAGHAEHLTDPPSWDRKLAGKVPGF